MLTPFPAAQWGVCASSFVLVPVSWLCAFTGPSARIVILLGSRTNTHISSRLLPHAHRHDNSAYACVSLDMVEYCLHRALVYATRARPTEPKPKPQTTLETALYREPRLIHGRAVSAGPPLGQHP